MGKNDVVKHDLLGVSAALDRHAEIRPIEMPRLPAVTPAPQVTPPTDVMLTGEVLKEAPYRSIGRMIIDFPDDGPFLASGWVVAPRALITAAHCVYNKKYGGWIKTGEFCPRFDLDCPKAWTVTTVYTLQGWIDDADFAYDLAACVVAAPFGDSEPPLVFDYYTLPSLQYAAVGYPGIPTAKHNFNGKRMWQSTGEYLKTEEGLIYAANDLTQGASGGPWLQTLESDEVGGITAGGKGNDPDVGASPIFADGFRNLYDAVKDL